MLKAFQFRLYPTRAQEKRLLNALDCARSLYNMSVAERKWAYQLEGRSVTKTEQLRTVKHYKATFPQARDVHSHILQVAVADCDKAFQAFFRRVKAGEKPGYPRFKGRQHFRSIGLKEYGNGFALSGRKLRVSGVGRVSVRWHRPLEGDIKTVRIVRKAGKWFASFACEAPDTAPLPATGRAVGIDVGISALLTMSNGEKVENPKFYRASQASLRVLQRRLARAQRGGKNRRKKLLAVQRQQEHVANQRKDALNKLIRNLVLEYDSIAIEDLRIRNMVRNKHLSKSILDSGWGYFRERLVSKAESAGRHVALVDPAYTSKCCSNCGAVFQDFSLSVRWVECECGLSLDRDENAARNILKRALKLDGRDAPVLQNVAPLPLGDTPAGKRKRAAEATRL